MSKKIEWGKSDDAVKKAEAKWIKRQQLLINLYRETARAKGELVHLNDLDYATGLTLSRYPWVPVDATSKGVLGVSEAGKSDIEIARLRMARYLVTIQQETAALEDKMAKSGYLSFPGGINNYFDTLRGWVLGA